MVYRLEVDQRCPRSLEKAGIVSTSEALDEDQDCDYGAIAMLEVPARRRELGLSTLLLRLKLWLLDRIDPCRDQGGSNKVTISDIFR